MTAAPPPSRQPPVPVVPVIAIVPGGDPDSVRARLDDLRAVTPAIGKIWLLQSPRDPAVDAIARAFAARRGPPRISVIGTDRPMGPWWPLMVAWFVRAPHTLVLAPGVRLAPPFVRAALDALRRHRAVICPAGRRAGSPVVPGSAPIEVDTGEGAWLLEAQWIRHAWAAPPAGLADDPMPGFHAALARAGIPTIVPAAVEGRGHLLAPAAG